MRHNSREKHRAFDCVRTARKLVPFNLQLTFLRTVSTFATLTDHMSNVKIISTEHDARMLRKDTKLVNT